MCDLISYLSRPADLKNGISKMFSNYITLLVNRNKIFSLKIITLFLNMLKKFAINILFSLLTQRSDAFVLT